MTNNDTPLDPTRMALEWMASHTLEVQKFADSRGIDKAFEAFEYAFEDLMIDDMDFVRPFLDETDEDDEANMNVIGFIMMECIKARYSLIDANRPKH